MTLIDSCVIIDILTAGPWAHWSESALLESGVTGPIEINTVILAEICAGPIPPPIIHRRIDELGIGIRHDLGDAVAHRAGHAHRLYRSRGGDRTAIVTDFLIGAHAAVLDAALLTRDRARFASYFPELTLITPEG